MGFLGALWLPIVLSAVIVFVVSSILHTVLHYHETDCKKLPDEDKAREALRGVTRGLYLIPYGTHKTMKSPETQEKYLQGPVAMLTVFPSGPPAIPKFLALWFGYCLIIGFFVAYLTWHTVAPGANYLVVFRVAGSAGFLTYGLGNISNGIWKGQPWGMTIKEIVDGLVYGLLTAGTFGWLWPR
ncbi:MAG TPA: hypothetical protein VMD99_05640 [Terriglobales bacterium]|nr:hypothetical protein [Terriglobales bacterium]